MSNYKQHPSNIVSYFHVDIIGGGRFDLMVNSQSKITKHEVFCIRDMANSPEACEPPLDGQRLKASKKGGFYNTPSGRLRIHPPFIL